MLNKSYEVPDYHLMVGNAENLGSVGVFTYADYLPDNVIQSMQTAHESTNGDITEAISNNVLSVNDASIQNKLIPLSVYGGV